MKFGLFAPVLLLCAAQAHAKRGVRAGSHPEHKHEPVVHDLAPAERHDTADDLFECIKVTREFLGEDVTRADAIAKAVEHCQSDKSLDDAAYTCPHFKEGVSRALELEPEDKLYCATSFCEATEAYMINIRGATRVPRTGSGSLLNFKESPLCEKSVAAAFAPDKTLPSSSVPDFWFSMCMNQDCAHFLPSRSRWCNVQREPTHSVLVCESARKFALDEVQVHEKGAMTPEQICTLYTEFVKEMGIDVESYEQVIHDKRPHVKSHGNERANLHVAKGLLALLSAASAVAALGGA